jgi:hypothetical protein
VAAVVGVDVAAGAQLLQGDAHARLGIVKLVGDIHSPDRAAPGAQNQDGLQIIFHRFTRFQAVASIRQSGYIRLTKYSKKIAKIQDFLFFPEKSQLVYLGVSQIIIWRAPRPYGASPTQPYKCGQYVKVKIKTNAVLTLTLILTF